MSVGGVRKAVTNGRLTTCVTASGRRIFHTEGPGTNPGIGKGLAGFRRGQGPFQPAGTGSPGCGNHARAYRRTAWSTSPAILPVVMPRGPGPVFPGPGHYVHTACAPAGPKCRWPEQNVGMDDIERGPEPSATGRAIDPNRAT